jgi:hypothetical protein
MSDEKKADNNGDEKKILIDSDWKEQAQKEKEELAGSAEEQAAAHGPHGEPPEPDFMQHCASLATHAMILLGAIANPMTGEAEYDPEQARYLVDTLVMLKEKTEGNLTAEEAESLDSLIGELKMVWVQITEARKKQ